MSANNVKDKAAALRKKHHKNENIDTVGCCCMVKNWSISSPDRSYVLDIVEDRKDLAYSNPKDKHYDLMIVSPKPTDKGMNTYKTIQIKHEFVKKTCDIGIRAFDDYGVSVFLEPDNDGLIIDSDGNFKINEKEEVLSDEEFASLHKHASTITEHTFLNNSQLLLADYIKCLNPSSMTI